MVETGRKQEEESGKAHSDMCRWRGKQQPPVQNLEAKPAETGGRTRDGHHGLPLPAGNEQVEQDRTPLFSFISLTWKGQPLINYETVVNLIGATKTKSGLRVKAVLDTNEYETGVKVTDSQME